MINLTFTFFFEFNNKMCFEFQTSAVPALLLVDMDQHLENDNTQAPMGVKKSGMRLNK